MWAKRRRLGVLAVGAGLAVVVAAAVFQPWLLWTDVTVKDEIPTVSDSAGTHGSSDTEMNEPVAGAANESVHDVALAEEQLREVRTFLACYASNECNRPGIHARTH